MDALCKLDRTKITRASKHTSNQASEKRTSTIALPWLEDAVSSTGALRPVPILFRGGHPASQDASKGTGIVRKHPCETAKRGQKRECAARERWAVVHEKQPLSSGSSPGLTSMSLVGPDEEAVGVAAACPPLLRPSPPSPPSPASLPIPSSPPPLVSLPARPRCTSARVYTLPRRGVR